MQSADFLSAVFFYLKVGENLNQNWIVENAPYIVFSALFHCSLYRGHIIARAAICFGNLELYFLAEQQQKYLLLT